ncbi:Arylesterase, partial [Oesophagostomum dentatum]
LTLDINKRVYNHRPGSCRQVEGVVYGSEDIALIEDEGIAFVTSGLIHLLGRGKDVKGQIFLYDFSQKGPYKVVPVKINGHYDKNNFHPHGISHFMRSDGGIRLFVINHSKKFEHSVMVFDWDRKSKELNLVRIIKDDKFIRPNDLAAISDNAFILTNDGSAQTTFTSFIEELLMIPTGSVVYYDGKASSWLIAKTRTPNGIFLHPDRKHLVVSHASAERISIYGLKKNYHSVSHVLDIPLLTLTDNVFVDKDGVIWTGAHPVLKETMRHLTDCENLKINASSQVLRITLSKDFKSYEVTEPFTDDGRFASGSSAAVTFKNQLLIGTVCRQLVHCYISPETVATS